MPSNRDKLNQCYATALHYAADVRTMTGSAGVSAFLWPNWDDYAPKLQDYLQRSRRVIPRDGFNPFHNEFERFEQVRLCLCFFSSSASLSSSERPPASKA